MGCDKDVIVTVVEVKSYRFTRDEIDVTNIQEGKHEGPVKEPWKSMLEGASTCAVEHHWGVRCDDHSFES